MSLMQKPSKIRENDEEDETDEEDVQNVAPTHSKSRIGKDPIQPSNSSAKPTRPETTPHHPISTITPQQQTTTNSNMTIHPHHHIRDKHSNEHSKLEMYKHIKPLSVDDLTGGRGKISYPSLDQVLNSDDWLSGDNVWMSYVLPSAPPMESHEDQISFPNIHDQISNNTLQYILPPILQHTHHHNEELPYNSEEIQEQEQQTTPPKLPPIVIHKIQPDDTLTSIALKYGVTEEAIKLKNRILSSDLSIYNKTELEIPDPTQLPKEHLKPEEMTEEERQKLEERKKAFALTLFMKLCCVSEDEARYYLSVHDFNFKEAVNELRSDLEWEKEYHEKLEKKKRKKQVNKMLNQYPILLSISNLLSTCFPIQKRPVKNNVNYQDVELDMLPDDNLINYDSE
ncbi:hypothetical protein FDP41_003883 [Naegleria fowleri]|uniref:LysM domain-containing protein n=1 Tax=Naegleria fowleri TaxID=5763 RepID=A0A6A5BTZ8_NAEFO|nr:uncharacterized protein FDP41_003883 [Naegleria fowleri]KAF0977230.1 hypothetical protein FDP41_003883 [Naegleria fowleri]CAG4709310.1 unnamed protein product [Naegleria fowleri]